MEQPWLDDEWQGRIDTPAALLDLDRLDANIGRMANAMRQRGMALRPHAKTHKSIQVARRQLAAGAVGLAVATIGEAEVFADAGVEDLFIAYPLFVRGPKSQRLRRLAEHCQLSVGIDSVEGAATLSAIGGQVGLRVLIEVDAGGRRTGVLPEDAGGLARRAADLGLEVVGVFTHAGHSYGGPDRRGPAGEDELVGLGAAARSLQARGIEPEVISAGSTPTALLSARAPVTEERPGTYVFGDRQQLGLAGNLGDPAGTIALVVAATVVSHGARGGFVVDAGAKVLAKDTAAYLSGHGEIVGYPDAVLTRVNDHHGVAEVPKGSRRPAVGEVVFIVPNHVCPVVNLADELLVVQRGAVVDRWRVDARGRNS